MLLPMISKRFRVVRPDDENDSIPFPKLRIVLAQLRQMPAAVRSGKAAIKDQYDMLLVVILRKGDFIALEISQREIGSNGLFL